MGNGFEDDVLIGSLVELATVFQAKEHVQDAVAMWATAVVGGACSDLGSLFYKPTVLTNMTNGMATFKQEAGIAVVLLFRFKG